MELDIQCVSTSHWTRERKKVRIDWSGKCTERASSMASAGMNRHGLLFTQSLREGESQPQQLGVERRARRCCIDWPSMTSRPNFLWIPPLLKRSYSPSPLMTNAQDYPKCSAGNGSRLLMTGILSFRWRILQHFFPIRLIQFRSTASLAQPKGPDRYLSIFSCFLTLSFRGEREKNKQKTGPKFNLSCHHQQREG